LVPVSLVDASPFGSPISFTVPGGYMISGITMEQTIALLRLLA
jgi:hypothetical protein